ncbi:MAG: type I-C CRISPR-associated protein Cas5 [Phycisphaerae bacterium]|nr:type I-C CRISPR-associated protein Cas5 [Phycisphaerae bacterium]
MEHNRAKIKVWGDFACFTRPEMKVERVSYDVITPSAARGILEAIYWKPEIRWVIERLHVLRPIRFTNIRRNEVSSKASAPGAKSIREGQPLGLYIEDARQQRAAAVLRDVAYVIEARFELVDETETIEKHYNMFKRRAEKGQCFHRPYLGCREFPASFAWIDGAIPATELPPDKQDDDFGFMLLDMDFIPDKKGPIIDSHAGRQLRAEPRFFRAEMKGGVIEVPPLAGLEVRS